MRYFAVILERGAAWDWSAPMRRQNGWESHAAFMDGLVDDGFIVVGGPLGSEDAAERILHIVYASDIAAVKDRFAKDPWHNDMLKTVSVDPWTILLGSLERRSPS